MTNQSPELTKAKITAEVLRLAAMRFRKALRAYPDKHWISELDEAEAIRAIALADPKLRSQARRNLERRVLGLYEKRKERS
jgi:hypothetical protein